MAADSRKIVRTISDERLRLFSSTAFTPPSLDPTTGVQSKDIQIAPEIPVSGRLYLPQNAGPHQNLPLIVYFHGGGFLTATAFSPLYHEHLNFLVAKTGAMAVSVEYRLAPANPIPAAFEDAWTSLKWIVSASCDEWIKQYADLRRVYLAGDSAGGNIAHNAAVRLGSEKLEGMELSGMFLNCPFFWGKDPIGREAAGFRDELIGDKGTVDRVLFCACPNLTSLDEPWINPGLDPKLAGLACRRVLVYVAEKDILKDRGWAYKAALEKSVWKGDVDVVEVKGEGHVFSVLCPEGDTSLAMFKKLASFIVRVPHSRNVPM